MPMIVFPIGLVSARIQQPCHQQRQRLADDMRKIAFAYVDENTVVNKGKRKEEIRRDRRSN